MTSTSYGLLPLLLLLIFASKDEDFNVKFDFDENHDGDFDLDATIQMNVLNDDVDNARIGSHQSSPKKQEVNFDQLNRKNMNEISFDRISFDSGSEDYAKERRSQFEEAFEAEDVTKAKKIYKSFTSQLQLNEKKKEEKNEKNMCSALLAKFPILQFSKVLSKTFVKNVVNMLLDSGRTVGDIRQSFMNIYLSIVTTNYAGMVQKAIFKVTKFCKKDIHYRLKVLAAIGLIVSVFGSFYLFAWKDIQEYVLELGNPIHEKDQSELLKSILLTIFILILKVPVTAIMPLLSGAFGVLISIMFPVTSVFVSTFFSGVGLGFWYLLHKLTGVDVIGWIGQNTVCGPLEFMFGKQWLNLTQEEYDAKKNKYLEENKYGSRRANLKAFYKEIAEPVTCSKDKSEKENSNALAQLSETMIFMRVVFMGIGDALLNTFSMQFAINFWMLFISLWLGLPENAFTSYALQIVKHPWVFALLMISVGGLETVTWIGKYIFHHVKQEKSMFRKATQAEEVLKKEDEEGKIEWVNKNYHEYRYDLFKKIFNLPIYIALFGLTYYARSILPFDIFQLEAYYTNKSSVDCYSAFAGEYNDLSYSYGEYGELSWAVSCIPSSKVYRNMYIAWGGVMSVITLLNLSQLVRDSIPFFKSRNYETGEFDNKQTFLYKKEKALLEGDATKLNDKFELLKNYYKLEENSKGSKTYERFLEMMINKFDKLIVENRSVKIKCEYPLSKSKDVKELCEEEEKKFVANDKKYKILKNKLEEEKSRLKSRLNDNQENKV